MSKYKFIGSFNKAYKAFENGKKPSQEAMEGMLKNMKSLDKMDDSDDLSGTIDKMYTFFTSPEFSEHLARTQQANEDLLQDQRVAQGLALANTIWDLGLSANQVAQSNRSLKGSKEPSRRRLPQIDPRLSQEIDRASQELSEPSFRELDPSRENIARTYAGELDQARVASAGQAGIYGALGQGAAQRRQQAGREMIPYASQLRQQAGGRLSQLLGMKESRQNVIDQIGENRYAQDLDMYLKEQQAAGQLGAVGRQNMAQSRGNLLTQLGPMASDITRAFRGMKVGEGEDELSLEDYNDYVNTSLFRKRAMPSYDQMNYNVGQYTGNIG